MKALRETLRNPFFWIGLALIAAYWLWLHPSGSWRGYVEDMCGFDMAREIMTENLKRFGTPTFHTRSFMAPGGVSVPYMSWSLEEMAMGIPTWIWNPEFPVLWVAYGLSLLLTFLGTGAILEKMRLGRRSAWILATVVVFFNVPRNFKVWQQFSHMTQHWAYLSIFLDAWIWQKLWRERRWSWRLEGWRGLFLAGTMLSTGYNWGVLILEWGIVRLAMLLTVAMRARSKQATRVEDRLIRAWLPTVLALPLLALELWWFLPLARESRKLSSVYQDVGWFAPLWQVVRPLWIDLPGLQPVNFTDTVVTVGWTLLIPAFLALFVLRKRRGGAGIGAVAPFLAFLFCALWYFGVPSGIWFQHFLQRVVPFLAFVRTSCRLALFVPPALGAVIALAWPELSAWARRNRDSRKIAFRGASLLFALMALVEARWLFAPVRRMPPMSGPMRELLAKTRAAPGTTVLDLPFCVAGGNGVCTWQECPNYPYSTTGQCFHGWHGKKVYGIYQGRLAPEQCSPYLQEPYLHWFDAWRNQTCFTAQDWDQFCAYLDGHPEIGAVLLYPDVWAGAGTASCLASFDSHLGAPLDQAEYFRTADPEGRGLYPSRVRLYGARCLRH